MSTQGLPGEKGEVGLAGEMGPKVGHCPSVLPPTHQSAVIGEFMNKNILSDVKRIKVIGR